MKIEAQEISIDKLLSASGEVFQIPMYQRSYDWSEDHWNDFWDDLYAITDDDIHFLGSIVIIANRHKKGLNFFEVVDGQQRLTTIILLLTAIRDLVETVIGTNVKTAEHINDRYLNSSTALGDHSLKLLLGKRDNHALERLIEKRPISEEDKNSRVVSAYNFFKQKLAENLDEWNIISENLLNSMNLVMITTESHYDAFRLFETLNNRGLELSSVDLIKNYLLGKIAIEESILNQCIDLWDTLIETLNGIDKVKFFRHYLLATQSGVVTKPELYEKYRRVLDSQGNIISYLEDLYGKSEIYYRLHKANTGNKKIDNHIIALIQIEASTSYSLLLKAISQNMDENSLIRIIQSIEIFTLRRSICKTTTRDLDRIYNHLAIEAFKTDNPSEYCVNYLQERAPSDEEFFSNFRDRDFKMSDQTKYILESIENYITNNTGEKLIGSRSSVHIEHIMPKEISSKQAIKKIGDWVSYLGENASNHNRYVNKIGNLTLLGSVLNITASNNPFNEKKKNYQLSNIQLTKELCNYNHWGFEELVERSHELAKIAVKIWSFS